MSTVSALIEIEESIGFDIINESCFIVGYGLYDYLQEITD